MRKRLHTVVFAGIQTFAFRRDGKMPDKNENKLKTSVLIGRIEEYIKSDDGKRKAAIYDKALQERVASRLKAEQMDWETLHTRVTI